MRGTAAKSLNCRRMPCFAVPPADEGVYSEEAGRSSALSGRIVLFFSHHRKGAGRNARALACRKLVSGRHNSGRCIVNTLRLVNAAAVDGALNQLIAH